MDIRVPNLLPGDKMAFFNDDNYPEICTVDDVGPDPTTDGNTLVLFKPGESRIGFSVPNYYKVSILDRPELI